MAKLTDVLGALLRDVAESRIQADLFSRQASIEYLNDPVLKNFPVPRAEVRVADIDFRFAVATATRTPVPTDKIIRAAVQSRIPELNSALLKIPFKALRTQPVTSARPLGELFAASRPELEKAWTENFTETVQSRVENGLEGLKTVGKDLATVALKGLREVSRSGNVAVFVGTDAQKLFQERAQSWADRLQGELKEVTTDSEEEPLQLEALITREDLAEIPEHALSQIKLTVVIENYEWHESEDEKGVLRRKLLLR